MSPTEKVFVIGATGNVGTPLVQILNERKVHTTVYARNPSKASELFGKLNQDYLTIVQGDYDDLTPIKNAISGHTRLFLVVTGFGNMPQIKGDIGEIAFAAGVKQVVDVSSIAVNSPWRSTYIGDEHRAAEEALLRAATNHEGDQKVISLRPGRFMSNLLHFEKPGLNDFQDTAPGDRAQSWISPNDIALTAANILTDDINKHGNRAYDLLGDVQTPIQRADILSRVLGRPYTYLRITPTEKYNALASAIPFPHSVLYDLVSSADALPDRVTSGLVVLLGREPETLEEYIRASANHKVLQ